ncbi:unnamed protein product [Protopolystoma xenopodis]|uniref:Uncharacterized protein n=1 Tax=Protopolystoma xenopodis TaxID=117903 RepID=A0A3S4ZY05_9PLAT|nr:unnamed protein product [Protopolystoma xenopodis]
MISSNADSSLFYIRHGVVKWIMLQAVQQLAADSTILPPPRPPYTSSSASNADPNANPSIMRWHMSQRPPQTRLLAIPCVEAKLLPHSSNTFRLAEPAQSGPQRYKRFLEMAFCLARSWYFDRDVFEVSHIMFLHEFQLHEQADFVSTITVGEHLTTG